MQIRAILLGVLPPRQTGGPLSRAQIVSGIARAGHEICAVAPVSAETFEEGDWFAARHPELRLVRYLVPEFHIEAARSQWQDLVALERKPIHRLVRELVGSFGPNVLIAGRESYGFFARELAGDLALPWTLWLRGSPTAEIVSGQLCERRAAPFLDLYRSADLVIAVGQYMVLGLEQRYGITGIRNIPNALDLDVFRPLPSSAALRAELGIPDGCRVVLLPGSLTSRKRPLDFLMAAQLVLEHQPAVTFLLAGGGALHDELVNFCCKRRIKDSVRFLGWITYERMPELYNAADLVVMASEAEGISRVYIEALACNRPLLASDILAARELIEDGQNGFLFEVGNHRQLAERILSLLQDSSLRAKVGRRGRASVADRGVDTAVQAYVREIQALLRRRQG